MATHPPMITNEVEFLPSSSIILAAVLDFAGGFIALLAPGYAAGWMGYDGVDFNIETASVRIMGAFIAFCCDFELFEKLVAALVNFCPCLLLPPSGPPSARLTSRACSFLSCWRFLVSLCFVAGARGHRAV